MYINKKWSNSILQKKIVIEGRAQFMVIQFGYEKVGVCNLYAPNFATERAQFWRHLRRVITATNILHWCLAADFNMLEEPVDRSGGRGCSIQGQELLEWEKLLFSLGITDAWGSPQFATRSESLIFSRSNGTQVNTNLSKIDRYYVFQFFREKGGHIEIIAGTVSSDHRPLFVGLKSQKNRKYTIVRIPGHITSNPKWNEEITNAWTLAQSEDSTDREKFVADIKRCQRILLDKSEDHIRKRKQEIQNMKRGVVSLQRLQEKDPLCMWTATRLDSANRDLKRAIDDKESFFSHNAYAKWTQKGDRVTNTFFNNFTPKVPTVGYLIASTSRWLNCYISH